MTIDIDPEIAELLTSLNRPVDQTASELIVLELYRQHEISVGRAAELLHMAVVEFMKYLSERDISLVEMSAEEIASELRTIDLLQKR